MSNTSDLEKQMEVACLKIKQLIDQVGSMIVGQRALLERMVVGLLCEGHVLLEGVPGLAKSLMVRALAQSLSASFRRIQFTPDLLPADLVGTQVFNPKDSEFFLKKGPVFANVILADEVNRAPPKVQSALLEAMQERQVTLAGQTLNLPEPFIVLATQNPIEHEGTYPLPEAQIDRFLLKVEVPYPSMEEEKEIVRRMANTGLDFAIEPTTTLEEIVQIRKLVNEVYVDDKVLSYALNLVFCTRNPEAFGLDPMSDLIQYGASPRASIALILVARAEAMLQGRAFVTPKDIKNVGLDVLRHRVIPSYEAEAEEVTSSVIVKRIFDHIEVP